jgi:hypothetical protein
MNIRSTTPAVKKIESNGITGANALWDGPLDITGFPLGKGSSNGSKGMKLKHSPCEYKEGPITQRAKRNG